MAKGNKKFILRTFYSDGTYAGTLTQDNFSGYPEFTMDINGGLSEIRIKSSFTFLEWWLPSDGILTTDTMTIPTEDYTGPTIQTFASNEFNVFNATYFGNTCELCVIENGEETQIWSGIYAGVKVTFDENRKEVFENILIPKPSRLSSRVFRSGSLTKFTLTKDPADMMKQILVNADVDITYTPTSIEDFGESFTYTFNAKTAQESIDAVLSLLGTDWYYFIGGDDVLYMGQVDTLATTHQIPLNAIKTFSVEKNLSLLRNRVLFLGSNSIFKQYEATSSQDTYGIYEERVTDTGITSANDAEALANRILRRQSILQTAFVIEIMDDNFTEGGYDIESIKPGDQIVIGTEFGDISYNYWGNFFWGQTYWKFDEYAISGIPATVKRITYKYDRVVVECAFNYQNLAELLNKTDKDVKEMQFEDAPTQPS